MRYVQRTTIVSIVLLLPVAAALGGLKEDPPPPDEGAFTYMGELHRLGESYSGTADFRFTLWDAPTAGAQVAPTQERSKLAVSDGLFQARLSFDETMFDGAARWLEIEVRTPSGEGRFTTLAPRQEIVSSRSDLRDVNADEAGDAGGDDSIVRDESNQDRGDLRAGDGASALRQDRSSGVLRDGSAVGPDGVPSALRRPNTLGDDGIEIAAPSPWRPDSNGIHYKVANVGIGTNAASNFRLFVRGDTAIFGRSDSRRGRGVFGLANKTTGPNFGVYGQSKSNRGTGVFGLHSAATGTAPGVQGETDSTSSLAMGVYGLVSSTSPGGSSAAVRGENRGTGGSGMGVWGSQDGSGWGVYGATVNGIGVFGEATASSGTNYGVYGSTASSTGYAGYFTGGRNYFQGNLGVGTSNPQDTLHLGNGQIRVDASSASATSGGGLELRRMDDGASTLMNIFSIYNQSGTLQANSHYGFSGGRLYITNNGGGNLTGVYLAPGGNSWTSSSDERLKESIQNVTYGLDDVLALRPRDFVWKENGLADTGFIAQEVYKVFPQAVSTTKNNEIGWGVDYVKLTPLLVAGIQELSKTVEAKDAEIDSLKERLSALESVVELLVSEQKGSAR